MLKELDAAMLKLPELLNKREVWDSLIINRRKPFTYRVFTQLDGGMRLCLHKFEPCFTDEAFFHPHPWPGAFCLLHGAYKMKVGLSDHRLAEPCDVMEMILTKHSMYEITNPMTWHSVIPLETSYSVMLNGQPWGESITHTQVRTTKGKDLEKMPEDELLKHLQIFKSFVHDYFQIATQNR